MESFSKRGSPSLVFILVILVLGVLVILRESRIFSDGNILFLSIVVTTGVLVWAGLIYSGKSVEHHRLPHTNIVITRFSILDCENNKKWKLYEKEADCKEREKQLFSRHRLDTKFDVFEKKTFPSILEQTASNYIWLIFVGEKLPTEYAERLSNLVAEADTDNVKIVPVKNLKEFEQKRKDLISVFPRYTTLRLDDDDYLHPDFLKTLNQYQNETGSIVSMTKGRKFTHAEDGEGFVEGEDMVCRNIGIGLAAVQDDIHLKGSHIDINKRFSVIYVDSLSPAYWLYAGEHTDTQRKFNEEP